MLSKYTSALISLAKQNKKESIETVLISKCQFNEQKAILMTQWFLDNFEYEYRKPDGESFCWDPDEVFSDEN